MRVVLGGIAVALAAIAACYSPEIPSETFRCAIDEPKCPPGQVCVMRAGVDRGICVDRDQAGIESESESESEAEGGEGEGCDKDGFDDRSEDGEPGRCNAQDAERGVEPDNSRFETALILNQAATGADFGEYQVCWPGDVDIYGWRVTGPRAETLCVIFDHDEGDLDAALYGPAPDRRREALSQSCDDDEELQIPAGVEGEVWYIVVNGWDGATNHYRIRAGRCP